MLLCAMFLLTGCNKPSISSNGIKVATDYLTSLDSYELSCDMTVYRTNKSVKMDVTVDYLKPNYYKVCFKNSNGHEQIIVKNDEGVFVLTPSLNKEFKFDSEWPLNSTHAYLLEAICNDISSDTASSFTVDGDTVIIESKIENKNNSASKLKFYYDSKEKKPMKACLQDDKGNDVILVEFKDFEANKSLNKDQFNSKLIMEEKSNSTENTSNVEEESKTLTITAGFVCDGATLASTQTSDDKTVLCYTGDNNYTIVVQKADIYSSCIAMEEYSKMDVLDCGLLLSNEVLSKYFIDDIEVIIYSSTLTEQEVISIVSDITLS